MRSASAWFNSTNRPTTPVASVIASVSSRPATAGCRRHKRQACPIGETRRALIGRPSSQRRRSSARASADRVASVRGFFQAGEADGFKVAGNPAVEPARRDGVLVADLVERLRARRSLKWGTACQQVVQECAQGMDIGSGTDRAGKGGHLLGGHVGRSPFGAVRAGLGRARLAFEAGDAEVGNLGGDDFPGGSWLAVEQDVRRLQIEVKNPAGVEVSDGAGDCLRESGGIPRRERLRQSILERSPGHIFKDEPQPFLGLVHAMDRHDMVVRYPRQRPRFTEPVLARVRIDQRVSRKQLDGDVALQRGFPGEVNHARSAPAQARAR